MVSGKGQTKRRAKSITLPNIWRLPHPGGFSSSTVLYEICGAYASTGLCCGVSFPFYVFQTRNSLHFFYSFINKKRLKIALEIRDGIRNVMIVLADFYTKIFHYCYDVSLVPPRPRAATCLPVLIPRTRESSNN